MRKYKYKLFSWSWANKLAPYQYEYECPEPCSMMGCPKHIAEVELGHASDTFRITFKKGEEMERTLYFDLTEMGLIADFIKRLTEI